MNISNLKQLAAIHKQKFWLISPIVAFGSLLISLPFIPVAIRLALCFIMTCLALFIYVILTTPGSPSKPIFVPVIELGFISSIYGILILANLESVSLLISALLCIGLALMFLWPKIKSGVKSARPTD